jgi:hypothetical protein
MARYREKDETDLRWNDIRRRITRQLDTEVAAFREAILNRLLVGAWDEFTKSLESGEILQLESHVADWVEDAMAESLGGKIDALDVAGMPGASNQ